MDFSFDSTIRMHSFPDYGIIRDDSMQMDYVLFNVPGLQKIVDHFKRKYGGEINIEVAPYCKTREFTIDDNKAAIRSVAMPLFAGLKMGGIAGILVVSYNEKGDTNHVVPMIIAKNINGRLIAVSFSPKQLSCEHLFREEIETGVLIHKTVTDFPELQHDLQSCSVIAVHALKGCLLNEDFGDSILSAKTELALPKTTIGQSSKFMTQPDKSHYARTFFSYSNPKKVNFLAFHRGHKWLSAIEGNEGHFMYCNGETRTMFRDIETERKRMREAISAAYRVFVAGIGADDAAVAPEDEFDFGDVFEAPLDLSPQKPVAKPAKAATVAFFKK